MKIIDLGQQRIADSEEIQDSLLVIGTGSLSNSPVDCIIVNADEPLRSAQGSNVSHAVVTAGGQELRDGHVAALGPETGQSCSPSSCVCVCVCVCVGCPRGRTPCGPGHTRAHSPCWRGQCAPHKNSRTGMSMHAHKRFIEASLRSGGVNNSVELNASQRHACRRCVS